MTEGSSLVGWRARVADIVDRLDRPWILRGLIAIALVALFAPVSLSRIIDGDEGYLLYAARMVSEGKLPYRDFFFGQMPGIPAVYGAVFFLTGPGWNASRLFACLVAVGIGLLVYENTVYLVHRRRYGLIAVFLYAFCGMTIGWMTITKTYGLALLCLMLASYFLIRPGRRGPFLAGMFIILAAGARLYVGSLGLLAIIYLLRREAGARERLRAVGLLAAGAVAGLVVLLPAILPDPVAFKFANWDFLRMRTEEKETSLIGSWEVKRNILFQIVPITGTDGAGGTQFTALAVLSLASVLSPRTPRNSWHALAWIALFVLNLLPHPPFTQYFCILIPFLAVETAVLLAGLEWRAIARPLVGLAAVYLVFAWADWDRYTNTGWKVEGLLPGQDKHAWLVPNVKKVAELIDAQGIPAGGGSWPGYYLSTRTKVVPGQTNDFGFLAADRLPPDRRPRYHVLTRPQILDGLSQRTPALYVAGNWRWPGLEQRLVQAGYKPAGQIANATVYVAR